MDQAQEFSELPAAIKAAQADANTALTGAIERAQKPGATSPREVAASEAKRQKTTK